MSSFLRLKRNQNWFFKCMSNSHILTISCSFRIETINTFIHSRSSLENHTGWFQTKMGKVYTRFQTKKGPKTTPFREAHTIWPKEGDPPPPLPPGHNFSISPGADRLLLSPSLRCGKARTMILMFSHHLGRHWQFNTRWVKKSFQGRLTGFDGGDQCTSELSLEKKCLLWRLAIKINAIKELRVDFRRKRTVTAPVTPARV